MADVARTWMKRVNVVSGDNHVVLEVPSRGEINKLIVNTVSGTNISKVTVYDREGAATGGVETLSVNPDDNLEELSALAHVVVPETSATSGLVALFEKSYGYQNQDEQAVTSKYRRQLHMKINAAGNATVDIAVTVLERTAQ